MDLHRIYGVTFQQLVIFQTAAKYGNFGKAAEELHMTTASVSRNIASLERQLDIQLFYRYRQRVYLTKAGEVLAKGIPAVQKSMDLLLSSAYRTEKESGRALCIGDGNVIPSTTYLLPILKKLESKYPDAELEISRVEPPALISGLHDGKFDLIFSLSIVKELTDAQDMCFVPVKQFHPKILISKNNPLYKEHGIHFEDQCNQKVVVMSNGIYEGYRGAVERVMNQIGIPLSQIKEVATPADVALELLRDNSISIMSELFAQVERESLTYVEIPRIRECWEICIAYLPDKQHALLGNFINCAKEALSSL